MLKKASDKDLMTALRTVAKGGSYFSPDVSASILRRIQTGDESKPVSSVLDGLSPSELQGGAVSCGGQNQQGIIGISHKLMQSFPTVFNHDSAPNIASEFRPPGDKLSFFQVGVPRQLGTC